MNTVVCPKCGSYKVVVDPEGVYYDGSGSVFKCAECENVFVVEREQNNYSLEYFYM